MLQDAKQKRPGCGLEGWGGMSRRNKIGRAAVSPALAVSEKDFAQAVVDLAQYTGWMIYRTWRSIHSPAGFPDLVLVRSKRLVFAELKKVGEHPTAEQAEWAEALYDTGKAEVYLWYPTDADWEEIERVLR